VEKVENKKHVSHFPTVPATAAAGCSHRRIMADVQVESMVGGTTFRRKLIQREIFPELWSSTSLANQAVLTHRLEKLRLDKAFSLIEGQPSWG
jgi:hypothetical protein